MTFQKVHNGTIAVCGEDDLMWPPVPWEAYDREVPVCHICQAMTGAPHLISRFDPEWAEFAFAVHHIEGPIHLVEAR